MVAPVTNLCHFDFNIKRRGKLLFTRWKNGVMSDTTFSLKTLRILCLYYPFPFYSIILFYFAVTCVTHASLGHMGSTVWISKPG